MSDVVVSREGALTILRLQRVEKKNALTGAMYSALSQALREANADDGVGAIVILGQPGIFCAGNDIKDFMGFAMGGGIGQPVLDFLRALVANEKPLVAGVDGAAIGIGTTMILHCDYALASNRSVFATPFVDLGLVPEAASSLIVPQLMGNRLAFEMLAMGAKFDANRARETGLINAVTEPATLEAQTLETARAIAAKPREAVRLARKLIRGDPSAILTRIDEEAKLFSERLMSQEARQAFEAFLAKGKS
ncbi:MAG: crotonase/enoyl-CoA hydratase family protein [Methylobacterium sp.]|nr:crotonase/enoyl-CoA hydratase family protein [Methylobacterium sp.]MCA3655560.1 crotonase/enoyl-CoA hydratase family protein [Methylobacterium sp.]MCA3658173.1 crotonase/enoyl-CoA hydratase family protein [Methylobacterium sp.]MCA3661801.1 crotonase/enoyl-CoA hydratase family protein [Methylobacterium sp.]MCA3662482.1 crotonase/enoyl-CoA hydratase family protein [Methylobacterium sp.]